MVLSPPLPIPLFLLFFYFKYIFLLFWGSDMITRDEIKKLGLKGSSADLEFVFNPVSLLRAKRGFSLVNCVAEIPTRIMNTVGCVIVLATDASCCTIFSLKLSMLLICARSLHLHLPLLLSFSLSLSLTLPLSLSPSPSPSPSPSLPLSYSLALSRTHTHCG